jgi:putative GTP pyrophosphokinase
MPFEQPVIPNRKKLQVEYESRHSVRAAILDGLQYVLGLELQKIGLHPAIKTRVKSFDKYYEKLLRLLSEAESRAEPVAITDVLGVRITCPFLDDLKSVEAAITRKFDVVGLERKGALHTFMEFGYESIHFLVDVPSDILSRLQVEESLVCEIQLCTILQDAWSEVEHELIYKGDASPFDEPLKRKLAALNATLTLSDTLFQEIRDYQRKRRLQFQKRRETFLDQMLTDADGMAQDLQADEDLSAARSQAERAPAADAEWHREDKRIDDLLMEALAAHNNRQFDEAIRIYSSIMDLELQDHIGSIVHVHRGMAYLAISDYENALEDFNCSVQLNSENCTAFHYRGLAYQVLQEYSMALQDFDCCLRLDPHRSTALYSRAQVRFRTGDGTGALEDCEQALNIAPEFLQAQKLRQQIRSKMRHDG